MDLTVAICTWNRCDLLREGLEQMLKLVIPTEVEWELLIVNNNCTDATDKVIATFASKLPIRRIFESKPGQSHARNAAVREALGRYILWTDDDTRVHENWIAAYIAAFRKWPEAVFFGGPVRPWFAVPPPVWLERVWPRVASAYATRDLGEQSLLFNGAERLPFGANFAVRTQEQRTHLYDPQFGLRPGGSLRGDEIQVLHSLHAEGHAGWWVPQASVEHYIPADRMTTRYIRQYYSGYGQYLAMIQLPSPGPKLFGKPRWLWRRILMAEINYRFHRLVSLPEIWIQYLIDASMAWGAFSMERPS